MQERTKGGPKGPYYSAHTHFSYNNSLIYNQHSFKSHETVQDMVNRAQQVMDDTKSFT